MTMFLQFFIRIAAIFCMIGFGVLAKKLKFIDSSATTQLSKLVTYFFYPALVFSSLVTNFTLETLLANWALPAGTIIIMSTGCIIGVIFVKIFHFGDKTQKGQFLFQTTINNYSFLPLPIILILWGEGGVAQLIFSTLGSEITLWTLGILVLTGNKLSMDSLRHLLSVPILAILSAIAVITFRSTAGGGAGEVIFSSEVFSLVSTSLMDMLDVFGAATIPLAMFLAGSRVADLKPRHFFAFKQISVVVLRLIIIPAAAIAILLSLPFSDELRRILLVVAVMPSAITSVMLSEVYNSDTDFAASSVLTTQLVSILTIPIWLSILTS